MQIFNKYENKGVALSIKQDTRYFLVYIGEIKREVIKLEALGLGRKRISGRIEKGEGIDPESKLGPFASVRVSGFQSNKSSSHKLNIYYVNELLLS